MPGYPFDGSSAQNRRYAGASMRASTLVATDAPRLKSVPGTAVGRRCQDRWNFSATRHVFISERQIHARQRVYEWR